MRDRGTLAISLVLLTALAAGSYWMAERARIGDITPRKVAHDPDYFADHFTVTRMDQTGAALYTLTSKRMVHYIDDDTATLEKPTFESLQVNRPKLNIQSDTGRVTSDGVEVHLNGNVSVRRAAVGADPEMIMRTEYLLVLPEEDIARTSKPAVVSQGNSYITGTGMEFNNGTRTLTVNNFGVGRGHAKLTPKPSNHH